MTHFTLADQTVDQISVMLNAGMEVTNTNIRIWIHDQDLAKLEKVVWEGMGHLLIKHTSAHNKIRKFLEAVPRLLNDIKKVHAASVTGDVDKIADQEFRQKVYLSKDVNGTSAFHKAIVNGHRDMADHLMEKTDRACFNIVDRNGRTGLHYAAALSQYDDIGMYGWLMNMGYDKSQQDYYAKTAEHYCSNSSEIDLAKCTIIPEAPRIKNQSVSGHSEAVNQSEGKDKANRLVSSPKKSPTKSPTKGSKSKKNKKRGSIVSAATTAIKNEKALYTFNPKTISNDQISKWVKTGNLEQLEIATLMGKGKQLLGKTSWNDATRNYIKNVQNVMDDLDAVFKCVAAGDVAKLKTLLEKNIKYVFARDNQGRSPLQVAAQNGQKEVTQCIIAENAEYTQITDPLNRTVLHYAARCPNEATRTEIIDEMIMNGADKFAKDAFGNDAEYYFTHELNTNKQLAVGSNDKPNGASNGQTDDEVFDDSSPVIESAIQDKNFDKLVKYVLEGDSERLSGRSSEDEEMQEFIKNIPAFQEKIESIHKAVQEGNLKSLETLLNRKKYAVAKEKATGASILHKAIIYGHTDIINFLCGHFPQTLNIKDRMGRTAYHYAAMCNDGGQYYQLVGSYGPDATISDSLGNTPEHYSKNKTEEDFNDLIDYVERRKAMPTDSGRSSSMSMSRGSTSNLAADIALTRWVMSIDTYKPTATEPLDQEILKKLDNGFRRLTWARRQFSQSLLKRFLVKSVFHTLKHRQTSGNINLYDIAKSGFEHLDSKIGVFAHNEECYKVFKPILHPVICTIHQATPLASHPKESNWSDIEHLEVELDPEGKYIDKITMTVSKNITPYPFVPSMTKSQFESLEREIRGTMKTMTTLTGVYYSLGSIPKDVKLILGREDLIFDNAGDKFLETAGVFNHWPAGRGVFLTHMKDVFIWINQLEHFTLGVTQKGGANIKNVFHRLFQTLQSINDSLRWSQDDFWGLVTMSPALIGSGLKIYVYVKLPYLGQEESFRQDLLDQYGLECVKAKHTLSDNRIFVLSNRRTFGLTESEILSSVHRCLKEMITIEQKFKDSAAKEREA